MRAGLERRRSQLLSHRLQQLPRSSESLDLAIVPNAGDAPGTEVALVAGVLNALQESIQAIAQSLRERPTSRGMVPIEIQEAVRLRVAFALPGSLELRMIPAFPSRQIPLFEDSSESLLQLSISELLCFLSRATTRQALLQHIATAGPRAATHLETLSSALDAGRTRLSNCAGDRMRSFARRGLRPSAPPISPRSDTSKMSQQDPRGPRSACR